MPASGLAVAKQPRPFCTSATTFSTSAVGELQRRGRPLHDDDADGDRSLEVGAGRSACPRADARHGFGRRHDGGTAVLHIPVLAVARPNVLGLSVVG